MSSGILAPEEKNRINADETSLVVTGGPAPGGNRDAATWFGQLQFEGWENFAATPMPVRTDEAWRFASIKSLDISSYTKPQPVSADEQAALIARSTGLEKISGRMIFANDQLLQREVLSEELKQKGVIWES